MIAFALLLLLPLVSANQKIVSCYFEIKDRSMEIDLDLCTHFILIGSCTLDSTCHVVLPPKEHIQELTQLRERNCWSKILISLTSNNLCFSKLSTNPNLTADFTSTMTNYLVNHSLHGLDIDWEFPVWSKDAQPSDKKGFAALIRELRQSFDSAKPGLLLTAAVAAPFSIVKVAYDIDAFNKYLDFVQIMNYDYHMYSKDQPVTGFNAPLFRKIMEIGILGKLNSDYSTQNWLKLGLYRNKTVFGIPTYGRGYTLLNKYAHFIYAPAVGEAHIGTSYGYTQICNLTKSADYKYVYDSKARSPYIYGGDKQWLGFEDPTSMFAKGTYAKYNNLAGIMIFDLNSDDYMGVCGKGKFCLTRAAKEALQ